MGRLSGPERDVLGGEADTGEEVKDILGVKYKVDMGRKRRRKKKPGNVF